MLVENTEDGDKNDKEKKSSFVLFRPPGTASRQERKIFWLKLALEGMTLALLVMTMLFVWQLTKGNDSSGSSKVSGFTTSSDFLKFLVLKIITSAHRDHGHHDCHLHHDHRGHHDYHLHHDHRGHHNYRRHYHQAKAFDILSLIKQNLTDSVCHSPQSFAKISPFLYFLSCGDGVPVPKLLRLRLVMHDIWSIPKMN